MEKENNILSILLDISKDLKETKEHIKSLVGLNIGHKKPNNNFRPNNGYKPNHNNNYKPNNYSSYNKK